MKKCTIQVRCRAQQSIDPSEVDTKNSIEGVLLPDRTGFVVHVLDKRGDEPGRRCPFLVEQFG